MPILPRRYERLRAVLNQRMANLTVLVEHVDKPHNLSAILRSCDAVGIILAKFFDLPQGILIPNRVVHRCRVSTIFRTALSWA